MLIEARNRWGLAICGGLGALSLSLLVGCADDLYAPCTLDPSSPDLAVQLCGDTSRELSCAVDNYVQCETRVCARYSGSAPFCTKRCSDDSDCPAGRCLEFPFQSGKLYCVENQLVEQ